jgi:cobalt-zinc-cadmium efflux system outer membrane protein
MLPSLKNRSVFGMGLFLAAMMANTSGILAQRPTAQTESPRDVLTLEKSVTWALQHNPELAVYRQQRGIARAGIVIARTYPYNPVFATAVMGDGGPATAGITNRVFNQTTLAQQLEVRMQGNIRRDLATASLSRVEWEVAVQEQHMAVQTIRSFLAYIYQREKLRILDESIRLQEETSKKVKQLVDQNIKLKAADFMLARSDELEARAQRGSRLTQVVTAWHALRRLMGVQKEILELDGNLPNTVPEGSPDQLTQLALQSRPDLQAVQMAYLEAEQRERLEIANRFGNPTIGAKTEYNETRVLFIGATVDFPVPIYNLRRGEILQRQAEKVKVMLERQRIEIQINQEVSAALDRLKESKKWVGSLEGEILPSLRKTMDDFDKLFAQGEVDVLRLIDVRRRYLRARDSHLDALWELNQARGDLAAAVGDFTLATEAPAAPKFGTPTAH